MYPNSSILNLEQSFSEESLGRIVCPEAVICLTWRRRTEQNHSTVSLTETQQAAWNLTLSF